MLEGKLALVTGASRGIGYAIAEALRKQGANVVGTATGEAGLRNIPGGKILDVRNAEQCDALIKELGDIAILVNNAGITRDNLILRMKEEDWDVVLDTNLKGAWNFSRAALRHMLKNENGGSVLNISSISGVVGMGGQSNYSASKAGMIGLTKALAREVASRNVSVNALALGLVATDMSQALDEAYRQKLREQIPMGRYAEPAEVARIACFLLSEDARYITGQVIQADGGMAM
jgi:3-oxoacyl-[acyl-carrier protein] reductase